MQRSFTFFSRQVLKFSFMLFTFVSSFTQTPLSALSPELSQLCIQFRLCVTCVATSAPSVTLGRPLSHTQAASPALCLIAPLSCQTSILYLECLNSWSFLRPAPPSASPSQLLRPKQESSLLILVSQPPVQSLRKSAGSLLGCTRPSALPPCLHCRHSVLNHPSSLIWHWPLTGHTPPPPLFPSRSSQCSGQRGPSVFAWSRPHWLRLKVQVLRWPAGPIISSPASLTPPPAPALLPPSLPAILASFCFSTHQGHSCSGTLPKWCPLGRLFPLHFPIPDPHLPQLCLNITFLSCCSSGFP